MQLLVATQGKWGQRIADHLSATHPSNWELVAWRGPAALPAVVDEPEAFLPDMLPQSNLLLVLTESPGMTDLSPELAELCGAEAVIVPVDRRPWAPPGLVLQVKKRLKSMDIASAFPVPFCSLSPRRSHHPLIRAFAQRYGLPKVSCKTEDGRVISCDVRREAPCGNTRYISQHLIGVPEKEASTKAGLLHHYYPCWGGMEVDPVHGTHTCLHISATMAQKSIEKALQNERDQHDKSA